MTSAGPPRRAEVLVGRSDELAVLRAALDDAAAGTGRLVLVVGEPGIGKTRLAQEIAGHALAVGSAVAWGRCVSADGAPPYWPWLQVLRTLGLDRAPLTDTIESPEERFSRYDDVASALGASPALVVIDDAHWADEPSLLLLRHLANRIADLPLLAVVTARDVEPHAPLRDHLAELVRAANATRLNLRGLGEQDVRAQLALSVAAEVADGRAREVA